MKVNPCRYCYLAMSYNGKHFANYTKKECCSCENRKKHRDYLDSKRKFSRGKTITNLDDLLKCEWVLFHGSTKHVEVIKSMPLRTVLMFLRCGAISEAVKKDI